MPNSPYCNPKIIKQSQFLLSCYPHSQNTNPLDHKQLDIIVINRIRSSMNPQQQQTPNPPKLHHSDSLVFSITAEKDDSPHDTDLLKNSYQEETEELYTLNNKLGQLQHKIKSIKTHHAVAEIDDDLQIRDHNENIDISNLTLGDDDRRAGRLYHKAKPKDIKVEHKDNKDGKQLKAEGKVEIITRPGTSSNSVFATKRVDCTFSHHESRGTPQAQSRKSKDRDSAQNRQYQAGDSIRSLRKQMLRLRLKMERSERSKSKCSEKLSQTKRSVKILECEKKKGDRLIATLAKDLKKSQNIRKKQKQTIIKQKKQIEQLKKLVSALKTSLRA